MAHGRHPPAPPDALHPRPYWSLVLRALREARGITQDGWAMQLGYGRSTVKRWEVGDAVPSAEAEAALLALCRDKGLLRSFAVGPLAGVCVTPEWLGELLAAARLDDRQGQPPEQQAIAAPDQESWSPPETQYARSGDLFIAYQVLGSGPIDVVQTPGALSHQEHMWECPLFTRGLQQLASFCRLITYDKRGTGMSDRVSDNQLPTVEERMDDVRAVMDAAGSARAVLFGVSEGAPMSILFAATYPERVAALILNGAFAAHPSAMRMTALEREQHLQALAESRGTAAEARTALQHFAPSVADDPEMQQWFAKLGRLAATPGAQMALAKMNWAIDVAHVLPAVRVPALVLHLTEDRSVPVAHGRYLATHIPGARLVEYPGEDHIFWFGDQAGAIVEEIRHFIAGIEPVDEIDHVLATVMAVAGSIPAARRDGFHTIVRREVDRYRGRLADTSEGGTLATFDGPARAIRCARALLVGVRGLGIDARAGLHTGACDIVGDRVGGPAVHTAQRLADVAASGAVLITSGVQDLIAGSGIEVAERGTHTLTEEPGTWRLFAVQ